MLQNDFFSGTTTIKPSKTEATQFQKFSILSQFQENSENLARPPVLNFIRFINYS
jgi:hypothetical protein